MRTLLPRFKGCFFAEVHGHVSSKDLPPTVFDKECLFGEFPESLETTDAILDLDLPLGVRVLLTMLRKLYQRSGRGRRENALYRGLDQKEPPFSFGGYSFASKRDVNYAI